MSGCSNSALSTYLRSIAYQSHAMSNSPARTCMQTSMTNDGCDRLKTKHVPEQNASTATVYSYNTDNTVYSVTDARGASATYSYNGRHQPTSNNRRSGWGYDADGRNTTIDTRTYTFDAAGQQRQMSAQQPIGNGSYITLNQSHSYDGDGAMLQEVNSQSNVQGNTTSYYLRSSVLRGAIVEEITASGQKHAGYVYSPGGQLVAEEIPGEYGHLAWKHLTPAGTSTYDYWTHNTYATDFWNGVELDPLGADVPTSPPPEPPPDEGDGDIGAGHFGGDMTSRYADVWNLAAGCTIDGMAASCSLAMGVFERGAGEESMPSFLLPRGRPHPFQNPEKPDRKPSMFSPFGTAWGFSFNSDFPIIGVVNIPMPREPILGSFINANGELILIERHGHDEPQKLIEKATTKADRLVQQNACKSFLEKLLLAAFLKLMPKGATLLPDEEAYVRGNLASVGALMTGVKGATAILLPDQPNKDRATARYVNQTITFY